jgi:ribonuclease BN (tRNA processing enzyme)
LCGQKLVRPAEGASLGAFCEQTVVPAQERRQVKIKLVPSSVSPGDASRGYFLSSYIIDEVVAIDAGGLGLIGDLTAQIPIRDIFLTHSHVDHVASLPVFLETVFQSTERSVTLHASAATLASLRRDLFNDRLWPDFIGMSERGVPFVRIEILEPARPVEVAGLRLTPIAVDHVVPTIGFLVEAPGVTVAIPSDTGPTDTFWRAASRAVDLKAVFLEASFPNSMTDLAIVSKHLTPAMFSVEARKLTQRVPFIAVHIKPRFYDQVVGELNALNLADLRIGMPGTTYEF